MHRNVRLGIAFSSMAVPLVIGCANEINPTKYVDGGLSDNLPCAMLQSHLEKEEIDGFIAIAPGEDVDRVTRIQLAVDASLRGPHPAVVRDSLGS